MTWYNGDEIIIDESGKPSGDIFAWGGMKISGNHINWDGKQLFPRITKETEKTGEDFSHG